MTDTTGASAATPNPQEPSVAVIAAADPTKAAHSEPVRGVTNVPRSTIDTGKFGRLFGELPGLSLDDAQIQAVVDVMVDATPGANTWGGSPGPADSDLPAGMTYLAQFIDHDITFDPTSMLDKANDPDALENFRTPRFDLDSLYGLGPVANPWLYDNDDTDKLLIGRRGAERGTAPVDVPRNEQERALMGDPRNDVHTIVSQLHLAMIRFHNAVVTMAKGDASLVTGVPATPVGGGWGGPAPASDTVSFGQIVTLVRWHYQWVVLNEFLPSIVGPQTYEGMWKKEGKSQVRRPDLKLYSVRKNPWMPVEFSGAAFRFGHTMVRDSYLLNGVVPPTPVFSPHAGDANPLGDLRGFRALPANWEIEWNRFFDALPGSDPSITQRARAFDTKIAPSLHTLPPRVDHLSRSLALLNLRRGVALGLPSGEDVERAVASETGVDLNKFSPVTTGLPHAAPLWFWILAEAEQRSGGKHLGPIGGRIVAEVLIGLALKDRSSYLKGDPGWQPNLPSASGQFRFSDILAIANSVPA